ncbi:MAG: serine--tRNA ligase, partial [Chloroflexi bacterium]|nr:serine--tRNA ligase [Chloroflexota bacterium]
MLDLALIRNEPERVKQAMRDLFDEDALSRIDLILEMDGRRRDLLQSVEEMRAEKNKVSKIIGQSRNAQERQKKIDEMKSLNARLGKQEEDLREVEANLDEQLLWIPNIPAEDVPIAQDDAANVVVREEGEKREFDFEPMAHWDLGTELNIIDFERGVKLSGSRFYVLRGLGARLQRALITWMLDVHINEHGYTEVYPPFIVREHCLVGTGNLPKFGENLYRDAEEDFWLIPTAEVPVTNLHRDEILKPGTLPL